MNGHGKRSKTIQSTALIHLGGALQPWLSSRGTENMHLSACHISPKCSRDSERFSVSVVQGRLRRGNSLRKNRAGQGSVRKTRVDHSPEFSPFYPHYWADFSVLS